MVPTQIPTYVGLYCQYHARFINISIFIVGMFHFCINLITYYSFICWHVSGMGYKHSYVIICYAFVLEYNGTTEAYGVLSYVTSEQKRLLSLNRKLITPKKQWIEC